MLTHKENEGIVLERQEIWILNTIDKYAFDKEKMIILFGSIIELNDEIRSKAIIEFISQNDDYELFEKLPLEIWHYGGWGSLIPSMKKEMLFFKSLVTKFSGIKYIKHRKRINDIIDEWNKRIEIEEVEEISNVRISI